MPSLEYYQMGEMVASTLPELAEQMDRCLAEWDPELPGAVNVADEVLTAALEAWLDLRAGDELLGRAFRLIETLASHADPDIRDAIQVGVVNWLAGDPDRLQKAKPFMGARTAEMLDALG
ncbi:MAG: hypothetical protein QNK05_00220 [Myxococcota bacterium]|nr:hypothetical protein [Myxococcota bacterium]